MKSYIRDEAQLITKPTSFVAVASFSLSESSGSAMSQTAILENEASSAGGSPPAGLSSQGLPSALH